MKYTNYLDCSYHRTKEDDAFYIGTHFIDLYRDYLLLE